MEVFQTTFNNVPVLATFHSCCSLYTNTSPHYDKKRQARQIKNTLSATHTNLSHTQDYLAIQYIQGTTAPLYTVGQNRLSLITLQRLVVEKRAIIKCQNFVQKIC